MGKINDIKVSENFKLYEFECNDGNHEVKVDPELVERLQKLRDKVNRPIIITSGYRTESYNKRVGGASESQHLLGKAADIKIVGVSPSKVADYAESVGFRGIGVYNSFTHVDVRPNKVRFKG